MHIHMQIITDESSCGLWLHTYILLTILSMSIYMHMHTYMLWFREPYTAGVVAHCVLVIMRKMSLAPPVSSSLVQHSAVAIAITVVYRALSL